MPASIIVKFGVAALAACVKTGARATIAGANQYATATENNTNHGTMIQRTDQVVSCSGGGNGFVFSDMWQGVQNDDGWVEAGTSHCDPGYTGRSYVRAKYINGSYAETFFETNVPAGVLKTWKYENTNCSSSTSNTYRLYLDGVERVSYGFSGGHSNSSDAGLETSGDWINSTMPATVAENMHGQNTCGGSYASWAGRDGCSVTYPSKMKGSWASDKAWKYSLNTGAIGGSPC